MLESDFNEAEKKLVCKISGRMDNENSEGIEKDLNKHLQKALPDVRENGAFNGDSIKIVFDLGGVDYVSSLFIRLCGATAQRTGIKSFAIVNSNARVKKIFKIAGLDDMLNLS